MGKGYEDLSRRALIKLGHDYDLEHDGDLQQYLTEHSDDYESIRPIETIVQRSDQLVETASRSMIGVKGVVNAAMNVAINKAADLAIDKADKLIGSAGTSIISNITKLPL